jgi:hypothetical protein
VNLTSSPQHRYRWRIVLVTIAALLVGSIAFASWYHAHYSMATAAAVNVLGAPGAPRVLIATQGSAFKNSVTTGLVDHLRGKSATIKVIDISLLPDAREEDWNALVVIHTWEMGRPPAEVSAFIDRLRNRHLLVMVTTSGAGDIRMEGVDAISSASTIADVPAVVGELVRRVDVVLARAP